ncbi:putative L-aspartate dehydrogenase [Pseudolycoriella hygida]|uniref:Aspartate dehydrogenase domain-containing protein n=1 Tax=Pseudolycoriella hygida TaxID=35572 RepID=A0A9Q0N3C5_9DIPT|nr:putative L-aspartate dehydrogenase [Pseudolycoriella hygida]
MATASNAKKFRVGILGYGSLGKHIHNQIQLRGDEIGFEIAFVWNRTATVLSQLPQELVLPKIEDFKLYEPDLVIEVAHPDVTKRFGAEILSKCDYFIGSPSVLADRELELSLTESIQNSKKRLFVPNGALWGTQEIRRMSNAGKLQAVEIEMRFHPHSLKLLGKLAELNATVNSTPVTLFEGPIREVCPLAPNNTNTMACAAIAAYSLGFDKVIGRLVSDPNLSDFHIIEINVYGPVTNGNQFHVLTRRMSPAKVGSVTSSATHDAFFNSIVQCRSLIDIGIVLC